MLPLVDGVDESVAFGVVEEPFEGVMAGALFSAGEDAPDPAEVEAAGAPLEFELVYGLLVAFLGLTHRRPVQSSRAVR